MKLLTVSVLVCSMMALAGAAALQEAEKENEAAITQEEEHRVKTRDKRSTRCPYGWTKHKGRCFLYVPQALSWARAEKNCLSLGANLASVHGIEEYSKIKRMILKKTHGHPKTWLGGSDSQEDGVWLWSDGTHFTFTNWCSGEPNYQQCLQMNYGDDNCWDDTYCNYALPSVCAKKI